jgi:hypothetical protein
MHSARKHLFAVVPITALSACSAPNMEAPGDLPALSEAAQMRRLTAWQYALEHNAGGETTTWSVSGEAHGSIAPIDTAFSSTDGWCRDYEEVIADEAKRYRLVGVSCRKPGQRWLVLDVRPFTETGPAQ